MSEIKIRAATAADADDIGKLASQFHEYLRQLGDRCDFYFNSTTYLRDGFGEHPAFIGFVAESEGSDVVGYLILSFGYDTDRSRRLAYVADLFVQESWRGRGVGNALMAHAAETARARGVETLWWGVHERNEDAMRFYEKLGARFVTGIRFMSIEIETLISK